MSKRSDLTIQASTIIFADIDDLKTVNDELGHDAGDYLIQAGDKWQLLDLEAAAR